MGGQRESYITFRNGAYYDEWNAKEQKYVRGFRQGNRAL
jgi:hypothetical protein